MPAVLFNPDAERSKIEFTLLVLTKYLENSEAVLKKGERELAASLARPDMQSIGVDTTEDDINFSKAMSVLGKMVFYRHNLVGRMRYGFVIQLYGAFEAEATALIKVIGQRHPAQAVALGNEPKFPELKQALLALGATPATLDEIDRLRHLRNLLAHHNGVFAHAKPLQKQTLDALIAAEEGIRVDDDGYVEVERSYCEKALSVVASFFNEMFPKFGFGQMFFTSSPHGYGVKCLPSESGHVFEFMERDEVAEEQATPEYQEVIGDPASDFDAIEDKPSPPPGESSGTTQGGASHSTPLPT